jgi:hypothetical protein
MFQPSPKPARLGDTYNGGQIFEWSGDGLPTPRGSKSMVKEQAQQLYHAALGLPYKGEWDPDLQTWTVDPELQGLTNGEVIILRQVRNAAAGDAKASENVMDRVLGKPKQAVESVSMNYSFSEYMAMIAEEEAQRTRGEAITVPSEPVYNDDSDLAELFG